MEHSRIGGRPGGDDEEDHNQYCYAWSISGWN